MTTLAGTSLISRFLDCLCDEARAQRPKTWDANDARAELDTLLALAIAAYEELGELTRPGDGKSPESLPTNDLDLVTAARDAYRRYHAACQPLLQLMSRARSLGVEPRRLVEFMRTVGEADLIAHRYDQIVEAERQATAGETRPLAEVRTELRRRVHTRGQ